AGTTTGGERLEQRARLLGGPALEQQPRELQLQPGRLLPLGGPDDEGPEHRDQRLELAAAAMALGERPKRDDVFWVSLVRTLDQRQRSCLVPEHLGRHLGGLHEEVGRARTAGGLGGALQESEQVLMP